MTIIKKLYLLLIIGFLATTIYGQKFTASVDKTVLGENERFQVYFQFEGGDYNKLKNFQGPSFKGLRKLGGPNQSSSMQVINGKVTSSITYTYVAVGTKVGNYTIGGASVVYEGKKYSTRPIAIKVVKAGSKQNGKSVGGVSTEELEKQCFIRAVPNKRSAFVGEQIIVEYKLYTKLSISSPSISKLPTYEGFWSEKLDQTWTGGLKPEMFNGERFNVATIEKVAVFPTKEGKLTITPFVLDVPIVVKRRNLSRDMFDSFFNDSFFGRSETIKHSASSKPITINVKPLPLAGQPESFNGVVGNFGFSSQINTTETDVNEPVTVKINIQGSGNLKLLELPKPELPAGFEIYDPKYSENISKKDYISGTKRIEYLVVPRVPGQKVIKPFEFCYFNPQKKKYVTHKSDEFTINVKSVNGEFNTPAVSGLTKEDIKLLSEDIRFIKTSVSGLEKKQERSLIGMWFWIVLVMPLLLLFVAVGVIKRNDKLAGNIELVRSRKAEKQAKNRLKKAKKFLSDGDRDNFYNELSSSLNGYLEDKLSIQRSEFTLEKAIDALSKRNINDELIGRVKAIFEKCEFARFAPGKDGMEAENELYKETVNVIVKIENNISNKK